MIVHCQSGFSRSAKEGQLVTVLHNGQSLQRDGGDFLTSLAERNYRIWYLKPIECNEGDIIEVQSKVGLKFLGADEDRSFTALFSVHEDVKENTFDFPKVGYGKEFPILKGKIKQIGLLTEREKRLQKIKANLESEEESGNTG